MGRGIRKLLTFIISYIIYIENVRENDTEALGIMKRHKLP